jgi:predicted metal-binding protein
MDRIIELPQIIISSRARTACCLPYGGHRKGCPNFAKRETCPPLHPLFGEMFDESLPVYAAIYIFDLASHVIRMQEMHPSWSKRQLECCLYWQAGARKRLRAIVDFSDLMRERIVDYVPEAGGVNVNATLEQVGIKLEWPPKNTVHLVALMGTKRKVDHVSPV